ncbi:hypothetical protein BJ912DRAFT_1144658 [Pholiota molesta]|nr:hypothetical protein BJ912DRAFT_1144658 [Pholiota molesta]
MKLSFAVFASVAYAIGASRAITLPILPGVPVEGTYAELYNLCESKGSQSYVGVLYADGTKKTFNFGECYPYAYGPVLAQQAVFCKGATCENNPNPDCTGGAIPPVPVVVPPLTTLINAADFVQLIGQGATCQPNILSGNLWN